MRAFEPLNRKPLNPKRHHPDRESGRGFLYAGSADAHAGDRQKTNRPLGSLENFGSLGSFGSLSGVNKVGFPGDRRHSPPRFPTLPKLPQFPKLPQKRRFRSSCSHTQRVWAADVCGNFVTGPRTRLRQGCAVASRCFGSETSGTSRTIILPFPSPVRGQTTPACHAIARRATAEASFHLSSFIFHLSSLIIHHCPRRARANCRTSSWFSRCCGALCPRRRQNAAPRLRVG